MNELEEEGEWHVKIKVKILSSAIRADEEDARQMTTCPRHNIYRLCLDVVRMPELDWLEISSSRINKLYK